MAQFIQIHTLTAYPPSNLNRDDLGRPKTAIVGGTQRLRVSSQSLKRSWRTSDEFRKAVDLQLGARTREVGNYVHDKLIKAQVDAKKAEKLGGAVASVFGKKEGKEDENSTRDARKTRQLAHVSRAEWAAIDALIDKVIAGGEVSEADLKGLLLNNPGSADIALFGRMLADSPAANVEAAAQVAHAITTHKVVVEEDYFSAVDDLNTREEDAGAGHIGTAEFGSGVFYGYICINYTELVKNLNGDEALAQSAVKGLLEAAATTSPSGKQNSFASRARPSYILVERGSQQPRTLQAAFLKGVTGSDLMEESIKALEDTRDKFDQVYGPCANSRRSINLLNGEGSFAELLD